jgi:hypothetical protein
VPTGLRAHPSQGPPRLRRRRAPHGEIFNAPITETTTIWEDNQSAIAYSHNALVSEKTKHIGMKWHFLKDHMQ